MQKLLIALVAVAIGGGAGFLAGRYSILHRNPGMVVALPQEAPPSNLAGKSRVLDALLIEEPFERVRAVADLAELGPGEIGDLQTALEASAVDRDLVEATLLVRLWARQDPRAAAEWAFRRPVHSFRPPLAAAAIEEWAARDPRTAAAAVDELTMRTPGDLLEAAEAALMRGWFDSGNLMGVEEYLDSRGVSVDQQRAMKAFLRRMVQRAGPQAAIDWAEAQPEEPERFRQAAIRQAAAEVAKADPQVAIAWCERICGTEWGKNVERQIASGWLTNDGEAALRWLATMNPGLERDLAVLSAYRFWWQKDKGGEARRWIEGIGRENLEEWMRPAMIIYAPSLALERPAEAVEWAMRAPDDRREDVLILVGKRWRRQDGAASEAWLEGSPLSAEAREKVRTAPAGQARSG